MHTVPYVPDHAPFTPEQRAWLNGFLAGMFSGAAPATEAMPKLQPLKIAVLYASQSGTGEGLARKVAKELKSKGHIAEMASLEGYEPKALAAEKHAIFVASTYGEGDPPDVAKPFFYRLCMEDAPRLESLTYALLSLGDRHYEHFCKFGADLDSRLTALGARPICERVECDVDVEEPFAMWKTALMARLEAIALGKADTASVPTAQVTQPIEAPTASSESAVYTRNRPLLATVREMRALTRDVSTKLTMHFAFSTADSGLKYEAGDAFGVVPQNDPRLVEEILFALSLSGCEEVELPAAGRVPLRDALTHHLQMTRLNRKMVQTYATKGECQTLKGLLIPEQQAHLDRYMFDRGLIDLLAEYPGVVTQPEELVALLPKLTPRLYSISSSPAAHGDEIHTTVAIVRYRAHNRERGGVCSTMLSDRLSAGETLPVYIQPNKKFRLPRQDDAPVIMIGPGTGVAPFRGFLHERRVTGSRGRNWLFFGERRADTDFLYREELEEMAADGHLTRLDTAFSRDQDHKIYVQDRMLEQSSLLWSWLEDGASVYVCGDATHMAKDVDAALHQVVERHGRMDVEGAREYVQNLREANRYQRDVY